MNAATRLLLVALSAALAACAGARTRFYTLQPAPGPAAPARYAGSPLRLDAVHIPPSLDRLELVRDDGADGRVVVSDNDHWVSSLGELLRRVLTQDLAARLPPGKVIFPDAPKPLGSGGLVVDILSLSSQGGAVTLQASWTVLAGKTAQGAPGAMRQRSVKLSTPAIGSGVSGNADELSALANDLAAAITDDLAGGAGAN